MYRTGKHTEKNYSLQQEAEASANRFNLGCIAVLALIAVLSEVMTLLGLFTVPNRIMLTTMVTALVFFLFPVLLCRLLRGKKDLFYCPWYKMLILWCAALGITMYCVALSFHAVICLAILPLLSAQYRMDRKLFIWTMISAILMVLLGVYGSFFFGMTDRNLLKSAGDAYPDLAARVALATPKRMTELLVHYAIPRLFGMVAIVLLVYGIANRHNRMLSRQSELSRQVREEIERLNAMQSKVIDDLATLIENRDQDTGDHVLRAKLYVRLLGKAMREDPLFRDRLPEEALDRMEHAAPLHDVGKIAVPDSILLKPGRLTPEEFDRMKLHTVKGGSMVENILSGVDEEEFLQTARDIVLYHHERWDGSGYPRGLRGEEIPLAARIMAVADVYDALVSPRVYKQPVAPEEALDIMEGESGTHFDPAIMRIVQSMRDTLITAAKTPLDQG